jgi:hypothetical protein
MQHRGVENARPAPRGPGAPSFRTSRRATRVIVAGQIGFEQRRDRQRHPPCREHLEHDRKATGEARHLDALVGLVFAHAQPLGAVGEHGRMTGDQVQAPFFHLPDGPRRAPSACERCSAHRSGRSPNPRWTALAHVEAPLHSSCSEANTPNFEPQVRLCWRAPRHGRSRCPTQPVKYRQRADACRETPVAARVALEVASTPMNPSTPIHLIPSLSPKRATPNPTRPGAVVREGAAHAAPPRLAHPHVPAPARASAKA